MLEENKIVPNKINKNKPIQCMKIFSGLFDFETRDIEEINNVFLQEKILMDIHKNDPYIGLSFSEEYLFNLIQSKGLFYFQYKNKEDIYEDVSKLLKNNLKVAIFKGKNRVLTDLDFNRCIIENSKLKKEYKILPKEITTYTDFHKIIEAHKSIPLIKNHNIYNPHDLIESFIKNEFDAIVTENTLVLKEQNRGLL